MRIALFGVVCLCLAACASTPQPRAATVTLYRDIWGVPHLYAAREEEGFYGLGYAQAEDQLIKLLGAVYWVRGRRAELEGASLLAVDIEQRRWLHASEGQAGFSRLHPQVRRNYEAFVAGVKRYMRDHPDQVPGWAPVFDAADMVAVARAVFWMGYAAVEGPAECQRAGVDLQASVRLAAGRQFKGASNGWVVAPARTASGAAILLADPHTELQSPAYYEYRMHAGETHSAGFALGPLLWQAHNNHISWAMTTGSPDLWDCYAVEVDPTNPARYLFDGEWREMLQVEEVFKVRDGESVTTTFEYTRHNGVLSPVVSRHGNQAYVVSASQMHDTGLLDNEVRAMNHARTVFDLRDAMAGLGMFPQNIVAADSAGNIWYLRAGKTPIRPAGHDWTRPVPGNSSDTAWLGFHALGEMVQWLNPPQGFLQNNNVAPDAMFADGNLDSSDYAAGLFNDTPGRMTTRGLRGMGVLSSASRFTVNDAISLAFDELWVTAEDWIGALRFALDRQPRWLEQQARETQELVHRLLGFDGVASADSVAALNFYYWRASMPGLLTQPDLAHLQTLPWRPEDFTQEFVSAILGQAERAARVMVDELGGTDVPMGAVFRVGRGERSWPLGGETIDAADVPDCLASLSSLCERTMRAFSSGSLDERGQRRALRGSNSMRLVELADPVRSWSLHVHGQSDDPASPHFDDQGELLSRREFKPTYFHRSDLEGHIESELELRIEP